MRSGALFWFGDGVPTGYENPFDEPALILIFKTEPRTPGYDAARLHYIQEVRQQLEEEHAAGAKFHFDELPDDHPARQFADGLVRASRRPSGA